MRYYHNLHFTDEEIKAQKDEPCNITVGHQGSYLHEDPRSGVAIPLDIGLHAQTGTPVQKKADGGSALKIVLLGI